MNLDNIIENLGLVATSLRCLDMIKQFNLCDFDLASMSKAEMIDKYDIIVDNILIHLDEIIKNKK